MRHFRLEYILLYLHRISVFTQNLGQTRQHLLYRLFLPEKLSHRNSQRFADQFNRIHRELRATVPGICKSTVRNPTVLRKLKDICVSGSQKLVQSCIRIQNHTHSYHKSKPLFTSMIALYQKQCTIIRTYRTRPTIRNSSSGEAGFGAYTLL